MMETRTPMMAALAVFLIVEMESSKLVRNVMKDQPIAIHTLIDAVLTARSPSVETELPTLMKSVTLVPPRAWAAQLIAPDLSVVME
jgi:hypothetical protein